MKIINIEGIIGRDVISSDIRNQLPGDNEDLQINISSPGGLISEGFRIFNVLKDYAGTVNTHLSGPAASMASYIFMVGKKRTAEKNAYLMIHNANMIAAGDYRDFAKYGKHLDALTNMIARETSSGSGKSLEEIRSAMDDETFYYGDDIVSNGFAHEMTGDAPQNKDEDIARAVLLIDECNKKISEPESLKKDIEFLATMFLKPEKDDKIENQKPQEDETMNEQELKEKFPDLYNKIKNEAGAAGVETGIAQERERVKGLVSLRAKFAKAHSQNVIDQAISEGHDVPTLTLNLMAAEQAAGELEKEKDHDTGEHGSEGGDTIPEMKDGIMSHESHVTETSDRLGKLVGLQIKK